MPASFLIPIISLVIILIFLIILMNYLYTYLALSSAPFEWTKAKKDGMIRSELLKLKYRYPHKTRFFTWWLQVRRLNRDGVQGDFAEVGVYKGDSASILHAMDPQREFHLFDTFEGFPTSDLDGETGEAATYTTKDFAGVNLEELLKRFERPGRIHIYKGYFPETSKPVENCSFALVNIDTDLYKPTSAALKFFYPRLSPGGILLIHDYNYKWPGIIRSVDEFTTTIPENPVFMPDADGTVIIVKNK